MKVKIFAALAASLMVMTAFAVCVAYSDCSDAANVTANSAVSKEGEVGSDGYYIGHVRIISWTGLGSSAAASCQFLSGNLPAGTTFSDSSKSARMSSGYYSYSQFILNGTCTAIGVYNFTVRGNANGTVQDCAVTISIYANVAFDSCGGGSVDTVKATSAFALPSPGSIDGYEFAGWYTASDGGVRVGGAGDSYTPSASTTLYAHWALAQRTVTFNGNGGAASQASATANIGSQITLPSASKQYHSFSGWYTAASGGTRVGGAGDQYTVTANTTLYAQYNVIPVSFTTTQDTAYIVQGSSFSYTAGTSPADASLSVSGASWLSVSGKNVAGTASPSVNPGTYHVTLTASYGTQSAVQSFDIVVVEKLIFESVPTGGIIALPA